MPQGSAKRPATVVITDADDDLPTLSYAKRFKATSTGETPKSQIRKNRPQTLPADKPKLFDDVDWRMHKKLPDIAFKLKQLDFHIKPWKSDLNASIKERRHAYFDVLKPPMMP